MSETQLQELNKLAIEAYDKMTTSAFMKSWERSVTKLQQCSGMTRTECMAIGAIALQVADGNYLDAGLAVDLIADIYDHTDKKVNAARIVYQTMDRWFEISTIKEDNT